MEMSGSDGGAQVFEWEVFKGRQARHPFTEDGPMTMPPDDPRHGTPNGYSNRKCRCRRCRAAWNAYHLDYLQRHPEQREKARLRARRGIRDPRTPAEWREAVDLARLCLLIDSAEQFGLITGPAVQVERCEVLLDRGARLGYRPRPDEVLIAEAFAS